MQIFLSLLNVLALLVQFFVSGFCNFFCVIFWCNEDEELNMMKRLKRLEEDEEDEDEDEDEDKDEDKDEDEEMIKMRIRMRMRM